MRAAIKAGDSATVHKLFSKASTPADLHQFLQIAAQSYSTARKQTGHAEIVELLLGQGATPTDDILFDAARDGSIDIVDRLVATGMILDIFGCAAIGDLPRVTKLLKNDPRLAQARISDDDKRYARFTPLHCCCLSSLGHTVPDRTARLRKVAQRLVTSGAQVNAVARFYGGRDVTPLDMVAHTGGELELAGFLIDQGATITRLAFGVALGRRGRGEACGMALAEFFLQRGFDINSPNGGETPLHGWANSGSPAVVQWLLDHGAAVNARDQLNRTPLHRAAERNVTAKITKMLIAAGADVHQKDTQGRTPLAVAQHHGKSAVAEVLKRAMLLDK